MKRRSRSLASVLAILALLFAQLMAAVHACEVDKPVKASVAAASDAQTGDDCCDHGQRAPDPACDNHCQQGKQNTERSTGFTVIPLVGAGFAMPGAPALAPLAPAGNPSLAPDLTRDTEPPISVRNCCFRI
ncbi:MAG TPA: hypothetical protein VFP36_10270 [Usitatibacter sp.]|nr:hypothetical protein [Usitatibacter sp.]